MKDLKIIATIIAKEENNEAILAELKKVVDSTRAEEGNISYALHRDTASPYKYSIIEHWSSQEAIDTHNATAHFNDFVKAIEGKIESIDVTTIEEIY